MRKYKVKVDINDTQFWEVEAESEQEAVDMVDYYMQSAPHIIERDTTKEYA